MNGENHNFDNASLPNQIRAVTLLLNTVNTSNYLEKHTIRNYDQNFQYLKVFNTTNHNCFSIFDSMNKLLLQLSEDRTLHVYYNYLYNLIKT